LFSKWPCRDSPRALSTSSFNAFSEPGRETAPHVKYTFAATPFSPATVRSHRKHDSNARRGNDIALESDYSLDDISPIKLFYRGAKASSEGRSMKTENKAHPSPTDREGGGSDCGPTDQYVQSSASNPFYFM
jgi:hypothetical protein